MRKQGGKGGRKKGRKEGRKGGWEWRREVRSEGRKGLLKDAAACVRVCNLDFFDLKYMQIESTDSCPWPRLAGGAGGEPCRPAASGAALAISRCVATRSSVAVTSAVVRPAAATSQFRVCTYLFLAASSLRRDLAGQHARRATYFVALKQPAHLPTCFRFVMAAFSGAGCLDRRLWLPCVAPLLSPFLSSSRPPLGCFVLTCPASTHALCVSRFAATCPPRHPSPVSCGCLQWSRLLLLAPVAAFSGAFLLCFLISSSCLPSGACLLPPPACRLVASVATSQQA